MKNFNLLVLLVMFQLVGCSTVSEQSSVVSKSNQLFTETWRNITETEAKFSLKNNEKKAVANRRSRVGGTGEFYQEALQRDDGVVFYIKFQDLQDNPTDLGVFLKEWFSELDEFKHAGMTWGEAFFQKTSAADNEGAEFAYAAMQGPERNCLVFAKRSLGNTEDGDDSQLALGSLCGQIGEGVEKVIDEKLVTAKSVNFDDGRYARNKLFAQAEERLEEIFLNESFIERVSPDINIQKAFRADKKLWIEGSIKDESRIEVVRVAGLLIDPTDIDGVFRLQIDGVPDDEVFRIVVTDEFGNSSESELHPQIVLNLPKAEVVYQLDEVDEGRKIALVIPVKDYQLSQFNLNTPVNDALLVSETLESVYGFDVQTLDSPTLDEIRGKLKSLSETLKPNDILLIYYAGHGYLYPEKAERDKQMSYWLPSDFSLTDPDNWLSDRELRSWIARLPTRQVLLVSDSCYSGRLVEGDVLYEPGGEYEYARTVMTSGSENPVPDGRGLYSDFAHAFNKSLRQVEKNDRVIAVDLYDQVRQEMHNNPLQEPQYGVLDKATHEDNADFAFSVKEN